jgi:hypothetical protein
MIAMRRSHAPGAKFDESPLPPNNIPNTDHPAQDHHDQPDEADQGANEEDFCQRAKLLPFVDHWRLLYFLKT